MPTPANATLDAVKGQLFNFSGVITSITTQNAITGGLTSLAAQISKDDGTYVATTNAPVEIGTSGIWSLDLTLTEVTATKLLITVTASNVGAVYSYVQINPADLSPQTQRFDLLPVIKTERMTLDVFSYFWNRNSLISSAISVYNSLGVLMGTGQNIPGNASNDKGKIT